MRAWLPVSLGVIFDEHILSFHAHVSSICRSSFYHLRKLSRTRKHLTITNMCIISWVEKGSHKVGSACISPVASKDTTDGSNGKLFRSCPNVKNARVNLKSSSRPARDNVGNQCFPVTNSLNVPRTELFPVYESHCIVCIWTNNSHEGAIDCSYGTRESCYVVEPSLRIIQLGRNWNELPFMLRNNSWNSVYYLIDDIITHSKQIPNYLIKADCCIKTQGQKDLLHRCDGQSSPRLMFVFQNGGECDNWIFPEAKPQTKLGVVIFF